MILQLADLKVTGTVLLKCVLQLYLLCDYSDFAIIKAVTRILVKPFRSLLSPPAVKEKGISISLYLEKKFKNILVILPKKNTKLSQ